MKWITSALAGLLLASQCTAQVFAADWVRNPAPLSDRDKWRVIDSTDWRGNSGVFLETPAATSPEGGDATIAAKCRSDHTSILFRPDDLNSFVFFYRRQQRLPAKVDGMRHELPVRHEPGHAHFFLGERGHQLFRRAIREELPVKIAVPIYPGPTEVFEWDMKGGAAARKEACP